MFVLFSRLKNILINQISYKNFYKIFYKIFSLIFEDMNYNQEQLYNTVVDLRTIHGEMLGGFYKNLDKDLNNNENKLELSFIDSMIETTRKVLQLAESKFNMQDSGIHSNFINNMNKTITQSGGANKYQNKPMLMLFHADWCGHCKHFMPTWIKLKREYVDSDKLNLVRISDKNTELIETFQIGGFPTIQLYDGKRFHEYTGGRDINNIRDYVNGMLKIQAIKD